MCELWFMSNCISFEEEEDGDDIMVLPISIPDSDRAERSSDAGILCG